MFDNISNKIKTLAQVVCWMGIISSVISGIVIMAMDEDLIFLGIIIIVIGSLISFFILYGFGQLIKNTNILVFNSEKDAEMAIYEELLDSGAITQEEFNKKKKQLLGL